ncbi:MAG: hypothetical protein SGPRY_008385 [Prymnesium sp.]
MAVPLGPSSSHTASDAPLEALEAQNHALFLRLALPPHHRGGRAVRAPPRVCSRLHDACRHAFAASEERGEPGGLFLCAGGEQATFWGFQNYDRVQSKLVPTVQRQFTTMLPLHELEDTRWRRLLFSALDGLEELVSFAKAQAGGHTLLACHMLRQDSQQACFAWHQDNLNNPNTQISMVFLLSDTRSTMQVAGSEPFVYDGSGSGVIFPSEAHHRSGPASNRTLKITFFFGVSQSSAAMFLSRKMRGEW